MNGENKKQEKNFKITIFLLGFFAGLAIFSLIGFLLTSLKLLACPECPPVNKVQEEQKEEKVLPQEKKEETIEDKIIREVGTFYEVNEEICKEEGKPLVLMFSTSWCPHCQWARPIFEKVVKEYVKQKKIVAYNWELDTNDNTLSKEKENNIPSNYSQIYQKFNPQGSIPTFVFGCRYYRVGTGHERENDTLAEEKEFKEIIEKLLTK